MPHIRHIQTFAFLLPVTLPFTTNFATESNDESIHLLPDYVVTGSHLIDDIKASPAPIQFVSGDELNLWSDLSPNAALRDLPVTFGYANSDNESNGGTGSAGANLRGLGNLSTLTLINGRRAGGSSAFGFQHGGFADLNLIPSAAIREIQIATGGTSVAYGSDAVAGTVNLLLRDDYIGNRVDASYSNTTDGDASEKALSFLTGQLIGEHTHLVLLGSWYQRNAIFARDRNISKTSDFTSQGGENQGSLSFPGRISVDGTEYVLIDPTSAPSDLSDYRLLDPDTDRFNFNDYASAIPSLERYSAMANISHQIGKDLEIWAELLYTETSFDNESAPAPWVTGENPFTDHPDYQTPLYLALIGHSQSLSPHFPSSITPRELKGLRFRNIALGNLNVKQQKDALRGLVGLRGEFKEWKWESAAMHIETNLEMNWSGIVDSNSLIDAIGDGTFNPFAPANASAATNGGYNNPGSLQDAEINAWERFEETYNSIDLKAGGPVVELPAGELESVVGFEYRKETVEAKIDSAILAGHTLGRSTGVSPYSAERDVLSVFTESVIPLLGSSNSSEPSLDLQLSVRYEDYEDTSSDVENNYDALVYKAGLVFQPTSYLTVRGAYGTAFRAPSLSESFSSAWGSLVYDDTTGPTLPYERVPTQYGANSELDPEVSQALNLEITIAPEADRGFQASINYYRIKTEDVITTNAQDLVDVDSTGTGPVFRNADDTLWFVTAQRFNAANLRTDGLNYELSYLHPTTNGRWEASFGVNQVLNYEVQGRSGAPYVSYLGRLVHPLVGGENVTGPGSIPRYKGYARLTWNEGNLTLGGTLNYIHSLDDNPAATTGNTSREIDSWCSLDLLASYGWPESSNAWLQNTRLTLGIENVSNEMPPFAAGAFADGYDSSLYTLEGRRASISISREF